jgi:hypothetical protein
MGRAACSCCSSGARCWSTSASAQVLDLFALALPPIASAPLCMLSSRLRCRALPPAPRPGPCQRTTGRAEPYQSVSLRVAVLSIARALSRWDGLSLRCSRILPSALGRAVPLRDKAACTLSVLLVRGSSTRSSGTVGGGSRPRVSQAAQETVKHTGEVPRDSLDLVGLPIAVKAIRNSGTGRRSGFRAGSGALGPFLGAAHRFLQHLQPTHLPPPHSVVVVQTFPQTPLLAVDPAAASSRCLLVDLAVASEPRLGYRPVLLTISSLRGLRA